MRSSGGYSDCVLLHGVRPLGAASDGRDLRAPVLAAIHHAPILGLELDRRPGVPDVFGGGTVFRVRGPAQGGVCQCVDLPFGHRGLLPVQAFRGRVHDGDEATADLRDVRPGGDVDAGHADGRKDTL